MYEINEKKHKYCDDNFMNNHKYHVINLLKIKDDEFNNLKPDYLIYRFSTALFDLFHSENKYGWLSDVKKHMGEKFYYDMIEGFVLDKHSI